MHDEWLRCGGCPVEFSAPGAGSSPSSAPRPLLPHHVNTQPVLGPAYLWRIVSIGCRKIHCFRFILVLLFKETPQKKKKMFRARSLVGRNSSDRMWLSRVTAMLLAFEMCAHKLNCKLPDLKRSTCILIQTYSDTLLTLREEPDTF